MAYAPIKTEDLKKQIMAGKKRAMNLAFNPGPKGADLLIIDRQKAPDVIGRVAKKEGEGSKVAYGSFVIDARKFKLTAEQELPGLAKKLRKYLKTLDYSYAIEVYDENGNILDAAVEDEEDDSAAYQQPAQEQQSALEPAAPAAEPDQRAEIADRLRALQPALTSFGSSAGPLVKAMAKVVAAMKAQNLDKAETMLVQIEGAVATVSAKRDSQAERPPPDPKTLMARAASLKAVLGDLPPKGSEAVKKALVTAISLLQARDFPAAEAKIAAAERAVNALSKQAPQPQAESTAQSTENETAEVSPERKPDPTLPPAPQQKEWERRQKVLEQAAATAAQTGRGDTKAIQSAMAYAKSQAALGKFDDALAAAERTTELIQEPSLTPPTGTPAAPPLSPEAVAACANSRKTWIDTRTRIKADLVKLKMAIDTQTQGINGLEDVASKTGGLLNHMAEMDGALEQTMTALIDTTDEAERQKRLQETQKIIGAYRTTLDTDFFRAVDNNGFVQTNIRASALTALDGIERALST